MTGQTSVDHSTSPPRIDIPRAYNATVDLIDVNLAAGGGAKVAVIDDRGRYTYAEIAERMARCGNALKALGVGLEQRVLLCMLDTVDFPAMFLGAIRLGAVPVPVNTLLTADDYAYMLRDSRARVAVVSAALFEKFKPALEGQPFLDKVVIAGGDVAGYPSLDALTRDASSDLKPAPTVCDDAAFWLYSSGSTGAPKGAVHVQSSLVQTAELYARPVLGITTDDVVFSAAKLFFAYGLGNALTFPFRVGATAILMAERPTPASVARVLTQHRPTIFYGVPTLYAALLASGDMPKREALNLRRCVSAGEALPRDLGDRWSAATGVDILDGIGSTEMLHIFISNGRPVPGYDARLVDDRGADVKPGEIGELLVRGPTGAAAYWNNRARSRSTFEGAWTRTGDKYTQDEDGYYIYSGRTDDMLKVGGIYVSPFEVEAALMSHAAVLEGAVIGVADENGLIKPKAYVVLKAKEQAAPAMADALKEHVKSRLAPYKYPRWIEFVTELPKTATGKIQRFKLRQRAAESITQAA
jgi:benzoate-CoA ligase